MSTDERPVLHLDIVACAASFQYDVPVARCNQGATGNDAVVRRRFLDGNPAETVKPPGKGPCKSFRHMLDDYDTGAIGRKGLQKDAQRLRTPGGCPHDDHLFRSSDHRHGSGFGHDRIGGQLWLDLPLLCCYLAWAHLAGRPYRVADLQCRFLKKLTGTKAWFFDD